MGITFRQGTEADSFLVFNVFIETVMDLGDRLGIMTITGGDDSQVIDSLWETRESMFVHLARTADQFWVAEQDGRLVGYARAIRRGPVQELTEFFVLPDCQSAGMGGELLQRAFPRGDEQYRVIVATLDERAMVRYLKAGVYPRFPLKTFSKSPEPCSLDPDIVAQPMEGSQSETEVLNEIDLQVLGHTRQQDHTWIRSRRLGYIYRRQGEAVGYGYLGRNNGPFALLYPGDFPAVLAHAETVAVGRWDRIGVEIPMINTAAVDYLLAQGFRMDAFTTMFMVNRPFGKFDHYIFFSPPFFI